MLSNDQLDNKQYGLMIYLDVLTGISLKYSYPKLLNSLNEDISMYQRHLSSDLIKFSYEILIGETYNSLNKNPEYRYNVDETYYPNPFNSFLNKKLYNKFVLPKEPDDPRDSDMVFLIDEQIEEKKYVMDRFNGICADIYQKSIKDDSLSVLHKIYGSCCHKGYINVHFDYTKCSSMSKIQKMIEILHSCNLKDAMININQMNQIEYNENNPGIYQSNFNTDIVRKICTYCEDIFGHNKYEVAQYFTKTDPNNIIKIINSSLNKVNNIYFYKLLIFIYAELDNYKLAIETYENAIELFGYMDPHFESDIKKLKLYHEKNGTTILFSQL